MRARLVVPSLAMGALLLAGASPAKKKEGAPPSIDHILIDVKSVPKSLVFFHDILGLPVDNRSPNSVILQAGNLKLYLWEDHWDWSPVPKGTRAPQGMYPHFVIPNVREVVAKMEKAGFRIVEQPEDHPWGTEAFVADPDGYVWALISQAN